MPPNAIPLTPLGGHDPDMGRVRADANPLHHLDVRLPRAARLACVGQLAGGFAHEVNTPIQYVSDSLDFLEAALAKLMPALAQANARHAAATDASMTEAGEGTAMSPVALRELLAEIPECMASAIEGIERIGGVVRTLQAVATSDTTSQSFVDVNKLLETAIAATRAEWKYVATISLDLEATLPPIVCVAGELLQAFVSLLVNAAQAVAEARASNPALSRTGVITVSTRSFGESIEVQVTDDGVGIPPEILDRVFDPFFATKPHDRAAGLGLALVDRVARYHGGRVYAQSARDAGATFTIALPIRDASA